MSYVASMAWGVQSLISTHWQVCLALGDEEVVAQIREAADAAVGIDGSAE